jgi:hypothetical protein
MARVMRVAARAVVGVPQGGATPIDTTGAGAPCAARSDSHPTKRMPYAVPRRAFRADEMLEGGIRE